MIMISVCYELKLLLFNTHTYNSNIKYNINSEQVYTLI